MLRSIGLLYCRGIRIRLPHQILSKMHPSILPVACKQLSRRVGLGYLVWCNHARLAFLRWG
jgi:hypothetical protein